jgi:hypothetical protein
VSLKLLLTLSGGLEALVGVLTLLSPTTAVMILFGGPVDTMTPVVTRLFGAGAFSLGLACLKARDAAATSAGLAVSLGMTSYNVLAAVLIIWAAAGLGLGGLLLWGTGMAHAVLGTLFVSSLLALKR